MADEEPPELEGLGDDLEALQMAWKNVSANARLPESFKGYLEQVSNLITHPILQSQARYEEEDVRKDKTKLVRFDYVCEALWTMTKNINDRETKSAMEASVQREVDFIESIAGMFAAAFAIFGGWRAVGKELAKAWKIADWITPVLRCDRELERRVKWLRKKALRQQPNRRKYRNVLIRY